MAAKAKSPPKVKPDFIQALELVSLCQREIGNEYQTHCVVRNGQICATDGLLSAGALISETIEATPHTLTLLRAVKGDEFSITKTDKSLMVKSGRLSVRVPCLGYSPEATIPDARSGPLNADFAIGLRTVGALARDSEAKTMNSTVLIRDGVMVATNNNVLMEYWHGNSFPVDIALPKMLVDLICKVDAEPVSYGVTDRSFTVYFKNNSWVRGMLKEGIWPTVPKLMDSASEPFAVPEYFFHGVKELTPFGADLKIEGSHLIVGDASFEIGEMPGMKFDMKSLFLIAPYALQFATEPSNRRLIFYGDKLRGCVACIR